MREISSFTYAPWNRMVFSSVSTNQEVKCKSHIIYHKLIVLIILSMGWTIDGIHQREMITPWRHTKGNMKRIIRDHKTYPGNAHIQDNKKTYPVQLLLRYELQSPAHELPPSRARQCDQESHHAPTRPIHYTSVFRLMYSRVSERLDRPKPDYDKKLIFARCGQKLAEKNIQCMCIYITMYAPERRTC